MSVCCHKTGNRLEMRESARLRTGDLGSKHNFATITLGGLDQCLISSSGMGVLDDSHHFRDPISSDSWRQGYLIGGAGAGGLAPWLQLALPPLAQFVPFKLRWEKHLALHGMAPGIVKALSLRGIQFYCSSRIRQSAEFGGDLVQVTQQMVSTLLGIVRIQCLGKCMHSNMSTYCSSPLPPKSQAHWELKG